MPRGPWRRVWILALVLFASSLLGWESYWRSQSVEPSYDLDIELWCEARRSVEPESVTLLGTSRIRSALRPELVGELLGAPTVMLGINGSSPLPVLEDLAADSSYRGLVIVDVIPRAIFDSTRAPEATSRVYLDTCEDSAGSPFKRVEAWLRMRVHESLVSRHPRLSLVPMLAALREGRMPDPPHYRVEATGFLRQDFGPSETDRRRAIRNTDRTRPLPASGVEEVVSRMHAAVAAIQARGGRVVLVRLPSSGEVLEYEQQEFPRERYWAPLARGPERVAIHYEDVPSLASFWCPDGSHLDHRDADRFARNLVAEIRVRMVRPSLSRSMVLR